MGNRFCELFGVKYPIVQGAMQWLSVPELASAVSNAGGLGIFTAATYPDKQALKEAIRKMKSMTDKPFAVNVSLFPTPSGKEIADDYVEAIIEEGVPIVETSGRSPEKYVPVLKAAGIKTMHKVPQVRHARRVERLGVDAITVIGFEAGGHPGMADVSTSILIPKAASELKVPLIAGGGIADARGLVAALAWGADAVVMGTRFMTSKECLLHQNFKDIVIAGNENDTGMALRSINNAIRIYKHNWAFRKVQEMENRNAALEELMTVIAGRLTREYYKTGDVDKCMFTVGQCMGLINEVKSVKEIIEGIMEEASLVMDSVRAKLY